MLTLNKFVFAKFEPAGSSDSSATVDEPEFCSLRTGFVTYRAHEPDLVATACHHVAKEIPWSEFG